MAGESQHVPDTGGPDPTVMTTQQLSIAIDNQRRISAAHLETVEAQFEVVRERFRGMNEATKVLHETVTRIPTDVQQAVGHLKELMAVELAAVAQQFKERDTRAEREARDNKIAVDAAFAAQEKLAVQQNEGNQVAIQKSEKATNETINKNAEAAEAKANALADKNDDLKAQVARLESQMIGLIERGVGGREQVNEHRNANAATIAAVGLGITLILGILTVIGFVLARTP